MSHKPWSEQGSQFTSFDCALEAGVLIFTLNRPEKRNCLTREFWVELPRAIALAERDPKVRCVLLRAEGHTFTAGIDLALLELLQQLGNGKESSRRAEYLRRTVLSLQDSVSVLEQTDLPVIAAIQGACIGGGLDLVCAADIRVASESARFQPMEVDLGFVPDIGTVQRLSQHLPPTWVADWLMSCRTVPADEAGRMGFISRLTTDDELQEEAMRLARTIATKSPVAIRGVKQSLRFTREYGVRAGLQYVAAWQSGVFPGADLGGALQARAAGEEAVFEDLALDLPVLGAQDESALRQEGPE